MYIRNTSFGVIPRNKYRNLFLQITEKTFNNELKFRIKIIQLCIVKEGGLTINQLPYIRLIAKINYFNSLPQNLARIYWLAKFRFQNHSIADEFHT